MADKGKYDTNDRLQLMKAAGLPEKEDLLRNGTRSFFLWNRLPLCLYLSRKGKPHVNKNWVSGSISFCSVKLHGGACHLSARIRVAFPATFFRETCAILFVVDPAVGVEPTAGLFAESFRPPQRNGGFPAGLQM